ncbi:MAG: hypothetical protein MZV63_59130 [Marinilabiliales bacterium]|nr:hypothetical protein [Marinilabiliales bacterium]
MTALSISGPSMLRGVASYSRKQLDELTEWVRRPQIGASGLVWARVEADGTVRSSVDKYYTADDLAEYCPYDGSRMPAI